MPETELNGFLNILKPPGMTSHDVVGHVRHVLRLKKVGHTGTLDPAVAGVLPLALGRATRLAEYVAEGGKRYRAEIILGAATDSQDATGTVVSEADASHLTQDAIEQALARFRGEILQVPPMVSAVKVGGKRLYELARAGQEVERAARPATVHELTLLAFRPGYRALLRVDVASSKGFYVRTLAHDLGAALGVGGHLNFLLRTVAGPFALAEALTLEELGERAVQGRVAEVVAPVEAALGSMPTVSVAGHWLELIRNGQVPNALAAKGPDYPPGPVAVLDQAGDLVALLEASAEGLRVRKVFA